MHRSIVPAAPVEPTFPGFAWALGKVWFFLYAPFRLEKGCVTPMFGKLKRIFSGSDISIPAPLSGAVVPLSEINDLTFSQGILGQGCAIRPNAQQVIAPVDGTISLMFETGHAISIETVDGTELLIHVGLDTVMLKGEHFTPHCKTGDKVRAGDLLLEFNATAIRAAGYDTITPIIVCNADHFSQITACFGQTVNAQDALLILRK